MKPFSTYPEDRENMLRMAKAVIDAPYLNNDFSDAAIELAELVKDTLEDEREVPLDDAWERHEADNKRLKACLVERDAFIVSKGLWMDYVDTLCSQEDFEKARKAETVK